MAIKVRATEKGFHDGRIRRPGDEFLVQTKEEIGSWMERAGGKAAKPSDSDSDPDSDKNPEGGAGLV